MSTTIHKYRTIEDLPSPKGKLILGHLPEFSSSQQHRVLEKWVSECGDLFKIHFVGKVFVVSANAQINHHILSQRPIKFRRLSKMDEILSEMGVNGVFSAEGDNWKRHRKPVAEALNQRNVNSFYPILASKARQLLLNFKQYATDNKTIDIRKDFTAYTVDITASVIFGYETNTLLNEKPRFLEYLDFIFPMINDRISAPLPLWRVYKQKKDRKLDEALTEIKKEIYEFIKEAKSRLAHNPDLRKNPSNFLEALLSENKEARFTDDDIFGNIFTMLLAGEDTTSNSIAWITYYLSQHPEMVSRIRNEATDVFVNDEVPSSSDQLALLTYTHAVVEEALRLKPTTPQLYMESLEEVVLNDIAFPKKTKFILQNHVPQTDETHFSNSKDFIPERWIPKECPAHYKHSPNVVKTFGGGARFCPGKNLAMNEMVLVIASICKQFDIELAVSPEEVTDQFKFTMYPDNLLIKLNPANNKTTSRA